MIILHMKVCIKSMSEAKQVLNVWQLIDTSLGAKKIHNPQNEGKHVPSSKVVKSKKELYYARM
jgi:hypothetical protein